MNDCNLNIALLIDAENVSYATLDFLESELAMLGRVTIKKCYGDFTKTNMKPWNAEFINKHSLEMIQQHSYTQRKNSSDIRLAIDAMDVLFEKTVNAICIMTSDSDFTGLAIRLKQSGVFVWGAGEEKTPEAFIKACDRFFKLKTGEAAESPNEEVAESGYTKEAIFDWVEQLIADNYSGGIDSGSLATKIRQRYPDFDWKNYGAKKFPDFLSQDERKRFDVQKNKSHSNITVLLK